MQQGALSCEHLSPWFYLGNSIIVDRIKLQEQDSLRLCLLGDKRFSRRVCDVWEEVAEVAEVVSFVMMYVGIMSKKDGDWRG